MNLVGIEMFAMDLLSAPDEIHEQGRQGFDFGDGPLRAAAMAERTKKRREEQAESACGNGIHGDHLIKRTAEMDSIKTMLLESADGQYRTWRMARINEYCETEVKCQF